MCPSPGNIYVHIFYARELLAGDTSLAVNLSPDHIFFFLSFYKESKGKNIYRYKIKPTSTWFGMQFRHILQHRCNYPTLKLIYVVTVSY